MEVKQPRSVISAFPKNVVTKKLNIECEKCILAVGLWPALVHWLLWGSERRGKGTK